MTHGKDIVQPHLSANRHLLHFKIFEIWYSYCLFLIYFVFLLTIDVIRKDMREDKECEKVTTRWLKIMGCVHRKNRKLMFGYI